MLSCNRPDGRSPEYRRQQGTSQSLVSQAATEQYLRKMTAALAAAPQHAATGAPCCTQESAACTLW